MQCESRHRLLCSNGLQPNFDIDCGPRVGVVDGKSTFSLKGARRGRGVAAVNCYGCAERCFFLAGQRGLQNGLGLFDRLNRVFFDTRRSGCITVMSEGGPAIDSTRCVKLQSLPESGGA